MQQPFIPMRHIYLSATLNTRDLGGYPAANGKITKWGVFFRSDAPLSLNETDREWLQKRNIHTAIDLRTKEQISLEPSALSTVEGIAYHHCPFAVGNRDPEFMGDFPNVYTELLSNHDTIKKVFSLFAKAEGSLLFHCAGGKDRTGLIAALLLLVSGVAEVDVLADYQISQTHLLPMLTKMRTDDPTLPPWYGRSDREDMEETLRRLFANYRNAEDFLLHCGVTSEEICRIREKLLMEGMSE